ncbi:MAG: hypothetical protein JW789_00355 [Candidatus Aenigmarchaeota archaeon]|nr:hypothetical protein [Candidatus Aenigmarchaeota archaeon]
MVSLYRSIIRYRNRESKIDKVYGDSSCFFPGHDSGMDDAKAELVSRFRKAYRSNPVIRDAVNGRRTISETACNYTMGDDAIFPGTKNRKMRQVNTYLMMATGINDPLEPPVFISGSRKMSHLMARAKFVDDYLSAYSGNIVASPEDMLPGGLSESLSRKPWIIRMLNEALESLHSTDSTNMTNSYWP